MSDSSQFEKKKPLKELSRRSRIAMSSDRKPAVSIADYCLSNVTILFYHMITNTSDYIMQ